MATIIGAEGLDMENGKDLLLCDNPQSFAKACINLLFDDDRCNRIGLAARKKAMQFYEKNNIIKLIQQNIRKYSKTS